MDSDFTPSGPVLDFEAALARLGGDRELFADLIGIFSEDAPQLLSEVHAAIASHDAPAVRVKAHALKGLVAGCGGVRAASVAQVLEDAGHAGDLNKAPSLVSTLQCELDSLAQALERFSQA